MYIVLRVDALGREHPTRCLISTQVARGGTIQYNQGPENYWFTFAETLQRLNISLIHLVRRDYVRAPCSTLSTKRRRVDGAGRPSFDVPRRSAPRSATTS